MPYLKEGQFRRTPTFGAAEGDETPAAPTNTETAGSKALAWIKKNWAYLAGALGVLIVLSLMLYFYKKGMLFASSFGGASSIY